MLFPRRSLTVAPRLFSCQRRAFFMPPSPPFTSTRSSRLYTEVEPAATEQTASPSCFGIRATFESTRCRSTSELIAPRLILTNVAAEWFLRRRESSAATEAWELKDPQGLAESTWIGRWIGAIMQADEKSVATLSRVYELQKGNPAVVVSYQSVYVSEQPEVHVHIERSEEADGEEAKWLICLRS